MPSRYFIAVDVVRDYLAGRRVEALECLLEATESPDVALWFSALPFMGETPAKQVGAVDRLRRLLDRGSLIPVQKRTILQSLGCDDAALAGAEAQLCSGIPGIKVLTRNPECWSTHNLPLEDPDATPGSVGPYPVPLVDLPAQFAAIGDELLEAIWGVASRSTYVLGSEVEAFEREFAAACGVRHAVGLNSGTDALHLALSALGIGPGDAVITVSNTFIATVEGIAMCGAEPVFVDVDINDYCMSPEALTAFLAERAEPDGNGFADRKTGHRLKALLPVHLYGQAAPLDKLLPTARRYGLHVLEDAAQAHLARARVGDRWTSVGSASDGATFSFFPAKNLGAMGDSGAFVTDRDDLAARVRALRNHGRSTKYLHDHYGWNSRMDAIQAAVLSVKLRHLRAWIDARRAAADRYRELLGGLDRIVLPTERLDADHTYHLYVVRVADGLRDRVRDRLMESTIGVGVHYPVPIHLQPALNSVTERWCLPVTERVSKEVLSLPIFPEITPLEQKWIAAELRKALESCAGV